MDGEDKIRILVVEDDPTRLEWFQKEFNGQDLTLATTAAAGVKYVNDEEFDVIFLDHDLGGRVFVDSEDDNTGCAVAKHIKASINAKTPVLIHSWNPAGARNIQTVLKHAVYIPFGRFNKTILKR